jgi:hypothetical protein
MRSDEGDDHDATSSPVRNTCVPSACHGRIRTLASGRIIDARELHRIVLRVIDSEIRLRLCHCGFVFVIRFIGRLGG